MAIDGPRWKKEKKGTPKEGLTGANRKRIPATETSNWIDRGETIPAADVPGGPAIIRGRLSVSFLIIRIFGQGSADCRGSGKRGEPWKRPGVSNRRNNADFLGRHGRRTPRVLRLAHDCREHILPARCRSHAPERTYDVRFDWSFRLVSELHFLCALIRYFLLFN